MTRKEILSAIRYIKNEIQSARDSIDPPIGKRRQNQRDVLCIQSHALRDAEWKLCELIIKLEKSFA